MMKQVIFPSTNTFCSYREKVRTKELYMYRHKWYGISVKGGRKKCMCTLQRLRTYIYIYIYKYIYVWMGTIRCKVETGKFGKLSQMTSIHNTTLI